MPAESHKTDVSIEGLQTWADLNKAIKETRSELVRLQNEGKIGTAEWEKYTAQLRQLTLQKQIVQRQVKLTSQQLLSLSRDLVVVGQGFKSLVKDIHELATTKKPIDEVVMSIGNIAIQALAVIPAIEGLRKSMIAMGIVSASTTAAMGSMITTLGLVAGAATAVGLAYGIMLRNFMNLGVVINAWQRIFRGENVFDVWTETTKVLTAGIIDLTDATQDAQNSIQGVNAKTSLGKQGTEFKGGKTPTGGFKNEVEEKKEELNLIKLKQIELDKLNTKLAANLGDLGAELTIRLQILEVMKEIFRLETGVDVDKLSFQSRSLGFEGDIKKRVGMFGTGGEFTNEELAQMREEEEALFSQMLSDTQSMWSNFQGMLQATGIMESDFGRIVAIINTVIGLGQNVGGFINAIGGIIGFLAGGPVGGAIGAVMGGSLAGGNIPNVGRSSAIQNHIHIHNPTTFKEAYRVTVNDEALKAI